MEGSCVAGVCVGWFDGWGELGGRLMCFCCVVAVYGVC